MIKKEEAELVKVQLTDVKAINAVIKHLVTNANQVSAIYGSGRNISIVFSDKIRLYYNDMSLTRAVVIAIDNINHPGCSRISIGDSTDPKITDLQILDCLHGLAVDKLNIAYCKSAIAPNAPLFLFDAVEGTHDCIKFPDIQYVDYQITETTREQVIKHIAPFDSHKNLMTSIISTEDVWEDTEQQNTYYVFDGPLHLWLILGKPYVRENDTDVVYRIKCMYRDNTDESSEEKEETPVESTDETKSDEGVFVKKDMVNTIPINEAPADPVTDKEVVPSNAPGYQQASAFATEDT